MVIGPRDFSSILSDLVRLRDPIPKGPSRPAGEVDVMGQMASLLAEQPPQQQPTDPYQGYGISARYQDDTPLEPQLIEQTPPTGEATGEVWGEDVPETLPEFLPEEARESYRAFTGEMGVTEPVQARQIFEELEEGVPQRDDMGVTNPFEAGRLARQSAGLALAIASQKTAALTTQETSLTNALELTKNIVGTRGVDQLVSAAEKDIAAITEGERRFSGDVFVADVQPFFDDLIENRPDLVSAIIKAEQGGTPILRTPEYKLALEAAKSHWFSSPEEQGLSEPRRLFLLKEGRLGEDRGRRRGLALKTLATPGALAQYAGYKGLAKGSLKEELESTLRDADDKEGMLRSSVGKALGVKPKDDSHPANNSVIMFKKGSDLDVRAVEVIVAYSRNIQTKVQLDEAKKSSALGNRVFSTLELLRFLDGKMTPQRLTVYMAAVEKDPSFFGSGLPIKERDASAGWNSKIIPAIKETARDILRTELLVKRDGESAMQHAARVSGVIDLLDVVPESFNMIRDSGFNERGVPYFVVSDSLYNDTRRAQPKMSSDPLDRAMAIGGDVVNAKQIEYVEKHVMPHVPNIPLTNAMAESLNPPKYRAFSMSFDPSVLERANREAHGTDTLLKILRDKPQTALGSSKVNEQVAQALHLKQQGATSAYLNSIVFAATEESMRTKSFTDVAGDWLEATGSVLPGLGRIIAIGVDDVASLSQAAVRLPAAGVAYAHGLITGDTSTAEQIIGESLEHLQEGLTLVSAVPQIAVGYAEHMAGYKDPETFLRRLRYHGPVLIYWDFLAGKAITSHFARAPGRVVLIRKSAIAQQPARVKGQAYFDYVVAQKKSVKDVQAMLDNIERIGRPSYTRKMRKDGKLTATEQKGAVEAYKETIAKHSDVIMPESVKPVHQTVFVIDDVAKPVVGQTQTPRAPLRERSGLGKPYVKPSRAERRARTVDQKVTAFKEWAPAKELGSFLYRSALEHIVSGKKGAGVVKSLLIDEARYGSQIQEMIHSAKAEDVRIVNIMLDGRNKAFARGHMDLWGVAHPKAVVDAILDGMRVHRNTILEGQIPVRVGGKTLKITEESLLTAIDDAVKANPEGFQNVMFEIARSGKVLDTSAFVVRVPVKHVGGKAKAQGGMVTLDLVDLGILRKNGKPKMFGRGAKKRPVAEAVLELWRKDEATISQKAVEIARNNLERLYKDGALVLDRMEETLTFFHPKTNEKFVIHRDDFYSQLDKFSREHAYKLMNQIYSKDGIDPGSFVFTNSQGKKADLLHTGFVEEAGAKIVPSQPLAGALYADSLSMHARHTGWSIETMSGQLQVLGEIMQANGGPRVVLSVDEAAWAKSPLMSGSKTLRQVLTEDSFLFRIQEQAVFPVPRNPNQYTSPVSLLKQVYGKENVRSTKFKGDPLVPGTNGQMLATNANWKGGNEWIAIEINTGKGFRSLTPKDIASLESKLAKNPIKDGYWKGKDLLVDGGFYDRLVPAHVMLDMRGSAIGRLMYNGGNSAEAAASLRRLYSQAKESAKGTLRGDKASGVGRDFSPIRDIAQKGDVDARILPEIAKNNPYAAAMAASELMTPQARMQWNLYMRDGVVPPFARSNSGIQASWERAGVWNAQKQAPTGLGLVSALFEFDHSTRWYQTLLTRSVLDEGYKYGSKVLDVHSIKAMPKGEHLAALTKTLRSHMIDHRRRMASIIADHINSGFYRSEKVAASVFEYAQEVWLKLLNENTKVHDPGVLDVAKSVVKRSQKKKRSPVDLLVDGLERGNLPALADPWVVGAITLKQLQNRLTNVRLVRSAIESGLIRGGKVGEKLDPNQWIKLDTKLVQEFGTEIEKAMKRGVDESLGVFSGQDLWINKTFAKDIGLKGRAHRIVEEARQGKGEIWSAVQETVGAKLPMGIDYVQNLWRTNLLFRGGYGSSVRNLVTNLTMITLIKPTMLASGQFWSDMFEYWTHANRYDRKTGKLAPGKLPDDASRHVIEVMGIETSGQRVLVGQPVQRGMPGEFTHHLGRVELATGKLIDYLQTTDEGRQIILEAQEAAKKSIKKINEAKRKRGAEKDAVFEELILDSAEVYESFYNNVIKAVIKKEPGLIDFAYGLAEKGYKPSNLLLDSLHMLNPTSKAFYKFHLGIGSARSAKLDIITDAFRYLFTATDESIRYAAAKHFHGLGYRDQALVRQVNGILPDFQRISGAMRGARYMHPFILYSLKQTAILAKAGAQHPNRFLAIRLLAEDMRAEEWANDPSNLAAALHYSLMKPSYLLGMSDGRQLNLESLMTTASADALDFSEVWVISELAQFIEDLYVAVDTEEQQESFLGVAASKLVRLSTAYHSFLGGSAQEPLLLDLGTLLRDAASGGLGRPQEYVHGKFAKRATEEGFGTAVSRLFGLDVKPGLTDEETGAVFLKTKIQLKNNMVRQVLKFRGVAKRKALRDLLSKGYISTDTVSDINTMAPSDPFGRAVWEVFKLDDPGMRRRFREAHASGMLDSLLDTAKDEAGKELGFQQENQGLDLRPTSSDQIYNEE